VTLSKRKGYCNCYWMCTYDPLVALLLTVWAKHWKTFWRQWRVDGIQCISSRWLQTCNGGKHMVICWNFTLIVYKDDDDGGWQ